MADMDRVKYEYEVAVAESVWLFEDECAALLNSGWVNQGGVSIASKRSVDTSYIVYAQAFVREVPREGDE